MSLCRRPPITSILTASKTQKKRTVEDNMKNDLPSRECAIGGMRSFVASNYIVNRPEGCGCPYKQSSASLPPLFYRLSRKRVCQASSLFSSASVHPGFALVGN
ncbi:hypothetical protein CDAR_12011 [Caerostris darwini]|uniref:Uncharacterized protein n=1 Tax=Caerostris darwini TaxID=1538125 RepID=A0AAV4M4P4_9ARAC|nr:hypothetical protein CDAR_12011 [Caerostris darwini]